MDKTTNKIWYVARNDQERYGPFTEEEIIKLLKFGKLDPEMYFWMPEFEYWIKISDSIYNFYYGQNVRN